MTTGSVLSQRFDGRLKVVMYTLEKEAMSVVLNLRGRILFDYLAQAYAQAFVDTTTKSEVRVAMSDWRTIRFAPAEAVLEVEQVRESSPPTTEAESRHASRQRNSPPIWVGGSRRRRLGPSTYVGEGAKKPQRRSSSAT